MNKLKSIFLYGGFDRETYKKIRGRFNDENRKSVRIFTLLSAGAFIFAGLGAVVGNPDVEIAIYLVGAGIFVLMCILNDVFHGKWPKISDVFAVSFSTLLLVAGVFISYSQKDERTAMLLPLFALVSLVFCYRPIYLITILTLTETAYLVIMYNVEDPSLFFINAVNTGIFYFVGLLGGVYTLCMKFKKYEVEYENSVLLEKDVLTGVFNRFSATKELEKITETKKFATIWSFDVNGLKIVNDTKGHLAGDELLIAAANCINDVFGRYGKIYRVGGDEFFAIVYDDVDEEKLRQEFRYKSSKWKGEMSDDLSVSVGVSTIDYEKDNDAQDAVYRADLQMYEEKNKYHELHKPSKNK